LTLEGKDYVIEVNIMAYVTV